MSVICELCRNAELAEIYAPKRAPLALKVHICRHCGLLQALPRIESGAETSFGATDGVRAQAALAALSRHSDLNREISVLETGCGSFAQAILASSSTANVTTVGETLAYWSANPDRSEAIRGKIEDVPLETGRFDAVYSCRKIDRTSEPGRLLADHWRILKSGGLLVLEVANVASIETAAGEWFANGNLYHFSARTLMRLVSAAGFAILSPPDPADRQNLLLIARKLTRGSEPVSEDSREVVEAERLIGVYASRRVKLRRAA